MSKENFLNLSSREINRGLSQGGEIHRWNIDDVDVLAIRLPADGDSDDPEGSEIEYKILVSDPTELASIKGLKSFDGSGSRFVVDEEEGVVMVIQNDGHTVTFESDENEHHLDEDPEPLNKDVIGIIDRLIPRSKGSLSPEAMQRIGWEGIVLDGNGKVVTKFEADKSRSSVDALRWILILTTGVKDKSPFEYLDKVDALKLRLGGLVEGKSRDLVSISLGVGRGSDFWEKVLQLGDNYVDNKTALINAGVSEEDIEEIEKRSLTMFEKDGMGDRSLKNAKDTVTNPMLLKLMINLYKAAKTGNVTSFLETMERRMLAQRLKGRDVLAMPLNPSDIKPSSVEKFIEYLEELAVQSAE